MFDMFFYVMFGVVWIVMYVVLIGVFGGMVFIVVKYGIGMFVLYGELMFCFYLMLIVFVVIVFGVVMWMCGLLLWKFFCYIKDEIFVMFGMVFIEVVFL